MPENLEKSKIKIGIECESIEGQSWGVGKIIYKLLEELAKRPELSKEFHFVLYFKKEIPKLAFLDNTIFEKKITRPIWANWVPFSFNIHYHIWMILRAYLDNVELLFLPNYMMPILWFRKSIVMLTDDIYYEMNSPKLPFRYRLAYNIFARWAAWRATRIMAISDTSRQHIARLFQIDPKRIFTNYLGISQPIPNDSQLTPKNYILYVGQMFPRRHAKESLEAFEILLQKDISEVGPDLKFIAVGTDKYTPPIINSLIGHINGRLGSEKIIRKEYVRDDELAELYKNAKVVVYISNREAFGLPPLEALAHGTPAIVSDNALTHELFQDFAFFVPQPIKIEDIAEAMHQALTNESKRQRIITNAPHILERFTWKKHTDIFLETVRSLF